MAYNRFPRIQNLLTSRYVIPILQYLKDNGKSNYTVMRTEMDIENSKFAYYLRAIRGYMLIVKDERTKSYELSYSGIKYLYHAKQIAKYPLEMK